MTAWFEAPPMRIGHGFDAHRLVEGRPLVIGGVTVPYERGALGHSDADVLVHAVADAVLGAAALGDLGTLFPDTDPQYKNANSLDLLWICAARVRDAGYAVLNVDATCVVQAPRLSPYVQAMRANVARVLSMPSAGVNVKAKTTEGMGYTGDGSGIAAHAVALLRRIEAIS